MKILEIEDYKTPASAYPKKQVGDARIIKIYYRKGFYKMHLIKGYTYYHLTKRTKITVLQLLQNKRWTDWMVDDPLHWYGMQEFAERARPGKVLVAGLGLGLIVHALVKRKDISEIKVVEINKNVIELISPLLPKDNRIEIHHDDYYKFIRKLRDEGYKPDTIICDIWSGGAGECQGEYEWCRYVTERYYPYPDVLSLYWGFQYLVDLSRKIYELPQGVFKIWRNSKK